MIWQMLTKIFFFNTLSACCFILIIILLHSEVADPTVQRSFHGFLDACLFSWFFFFQILLQNFMLENYNLFRDRLTIGGIWCWVFSLGYWEVRGCIPIKACISSYSVLILKKPNPEHNNAAVGCWHVKYLIIL